jgi:YHS domain-containing protein
MKIFKVRRTFLPKNTYYLYSSFAGFICPSVKKNKTVLLSISRQGLGGMGSTFEYQKNKKMKSRFFFMAMMTGLFSIAAVAQDPSALRKKQFNLDDNIAIDGYDPVAYFKVNKAVKGKKDLAVSHQGVIYYFSSAENKEEFKKNPSPYEPEYGGWCAYAMGEKGEKVSIDPATFKILNGKLYLFYNRFFNNTLKSWNKDEAKLKPAADASWKKFYH